MARQCGFHAFVKFLSRKGTVYNEIYRHIFIIFKVVYFPILVPNTILCIYLQLVVFDMWIKENKLL